VGFIVFARHRNQHVCVPWQLVAGLLATRIAVNLDAEARAHVR